MSENKRSFGGRGYYIGLVLCAAAVGILSYVYSTTGEEPEVQAANAPVSITDTVTLPTAPQKPGETAPSTEPTAGKLSVCAPVQGEVLSGYAMEVLSYNETTRDWRVHNGVDFAAPEGTAVVAAADGQVYTVYEDDQMGMTVVIRHDGGYVTEYSSLAKELSVKSGEAVHMGQVIGCVGGTALVETTLGSHVHFGVTFQDAPMDPAEFLALGS